MLTVGLSAEESASVWQCVAALMLLGNLEFGGGDRGVVSDVVTMRKASDMLTPDPHPHPHPHPHAHPHPNPLPNPYPNP